MKIAAILLAVLGAPPALAFDPFSSPVASPGQQEQTRAAPYDAVRWRGEVPEVHVDGRWYELLALDGIAAERICAFSRETWPDRWRKRVAEDLVELLERMGHSPGGAVDLALRDLESGELLEMEGVEMTLAKRQSAWRYNQTGRLPGEEVRRVEREHAERVPAGLELLAEPVPTGDVAGTVWLSREEAAADLDQLEWVLEHRYSYLRLKGVDYRAALDAVRLGIGERIERASFAVQLTKLLALFGDGHTRVDESRAAMLLPRENAPYLVERTGERLAAFHADRSGFLDPESPYLTGLDGVDVEVWLDVAARLAPQGSPQLIRQSAIGDLRYVQHLRRTMGLEETPSVELSLESERGRVRKLDVLLADRRGIYGEWPRTEHRILEERFGYLRLPRMSSDPDFLRGLAEAMERFRDTDGLVIDVRGNGGGSRAALALLFPYFMRPSDELRVVNVAAYRLPPGTPRGRPEGYLENRMAFPLSSSRWTEREKELLERLAADFRPQWRPPAQEFSDWHFFAIRPHPEGEGHVYRAPLVVLSSYDCYSATDIFLGAFHGWRGVTLMGQPSGGGSGRSEGYRLEHSGIEFRASTMASFRPDGRLYDGSGIEPDLFVPAEPGFFVGASDEVLDRAVQHLERKAR